MRNDCREAAMCVLFAEQFNEEGCTREFINRVYKKFNIEKKRRTGICGRAVKRGERTSPGNYFRNRSGFASLS